VFFRSESMKGALSLVRGMVGMDGVALPAAVFAHLGPVAAVLRSWGLAVDSVWSVHDVLRITAWIMPLLCIVLFFPNTLQVLARFEPALGLKGQAVGQPTGVSWAQWNASVLWAVMTSVLMAAAVQRLSGPSEFLYWQF